MELKSVEDTSWLQLFIKTQHCANTKVDVYGVTPARCRKVNDGVSGNAKLLIEAPVNGGRNYNGPKVAKFLVG